MPLIPYAVDQIILPVTDRVYNDTIIKQKAAFSHLTHTQTLTGSNVEIDVVVSMYANDSGGYGDLLTGPGFTPYHKSLGADNDTIVDAQTGEILLVRADESDEYWLTKAEMHPKNVMFQADFFLMLRDTQAINIGDLIKLHIIQADALGRFQ